MAEVGLQKQEIQRSLTNGNIVKRTDGKTEIKFKRGNSVFSFIIEVQDINNEIPFNTIFEGIKTSLRQITPDITDGRVCEIIKEESFTAILTALGLRIKPELEN